MEGESDKDALCHRFYSTYTASALSKEDLEGLGDFTIGVQVLRTVRYANDLVVLPKEPRSYILLQYTYYTIQYTTGLQHVTANPGQTHWNNPHIP
jgi:hypothetical protein